VIESLWVVAGFALCVALAALGVGLALARRYQELRAGLVDAGLVRPAPAGLAGDGTWLPASGTAVPAGLTMTTKGGEVLTAADFTGADVVLVFLTSPCNACRAALPELRAALTALPAGGPSPVVVLSGDGAAWPEYLMALSGLVRPVENGDDVPKGAGVADLLGVHSYPAVLVLGGGVVRRAGMSVADVELSVSSTASPPPPRGVARSRP
jgi:hypothetical protein